MDVPAPLKALIEALRNKAGLAPQQTPGPAMDAMGGFRAANLQRAEQGLPPLSAAEYMQQLQQPPAGATPR